MKVEINEAKKEEIDWNKKQLVRNELKLKRISKYKIGDKIEVPNMGFMGLETYIGTVVGINYKQYIIDFGKTFVEQRFQTRLKSDYE